MACFLVNDLSTNKRCQLEKESLFIAVHCTFYLFGGSLCHVAVIAIKCLTKPPSHLRHCCAPVRSNLVVVGVDQENKFGETSPLSNWNIPSGNQTWQLKILYTWYKWTCSRKHNFGFPVAMFYCLKVSCVYIVSAKR